jgi:hypothetical protein
MHIIPIDKANIPEYFSIDLANETFILSFAYNEVGDFFTVSLLKPNEAGEDTELIMGEKLTLNKPLWSDFTNMDLPAPQLIPLDLSGQENRITWENLNVTVFLYVNDGEPVD